MKTTIPRSHPRYQSLVTRELLVEGMQKGLVHETGLIAHGRGEAFDYLLGEVTIPSALLSEKVAAAALLLAKNPVVSINGNVAALSVKECISLASEVPAALEVNLFHRSSERMKRITDFLHQHGATHVLGGKGDAIIPGLDHNRALCDKKGIYDADVVLVPLEDGDRCQALRKMGKTVIAIDLNPLSRTAKYASIAIVDNVIRAIPSIEQFIRELKTSERTTLQMLVTSFDNQQNLKEVLAFLSKRLNSLS